MIASAKQPRFLVGMPHHGLVTFRAAQGLHRATASRESHLSDCNSSLLAYAFNLLLCEALNLRIRGVTHFAMLHDDVAPEPFWVDKLYEVMQAEQAAVVSAVVPIKNGLGLTSTAIESGNPYHPRKLTMREVFTKPETFSEFENQPLLVNTGCLLIDVRQPWLDEVDEDGNAKALFTIRDIRRVVNGQWRAYVAPEDWNFSRMAHLAGVKVCATRAVRVEHTGTIQFPNTQAWGDWDTDRSVPTARVTEGEEEHGQQVAEADRRVAQGA